MRSYFSCRSHSLILRRAAATMLALAWISLASSCHRNNVETCEICDAAGKGDLAKVQALLKGHPDLVFRKNKNGSTPLHGAVFYDHKEAAELLLAN